MVHGIADQRAGDTVREVARLLCHGGAGEPRYVHGEVHEVLVPMATVVHQGMSLGREPDGKVALVPDPALTEKPFFVDDCHSWRADGAVVARFYPQFSRRGPMFK